MVEACRPLAEYAWLIDEIRTNWKNAVMDIEAAVDKAINDMPIEYVLRDFLLGHKADRIGR